MIAFDTSILMLRVLPVVDELKSVVYAVEWCTTATDGDLRARYVNESQVAAPDPATFVAFDQLTPELVLTWLAPLTPELEAMLTDDLARQAADALVVFKALPWEAP